MARCFSHVRVAAVAGMCLRPPIAALAETLIVRLAGLGARCGKVVRPLYLLTAFRCHALPAHRAPPPVPPDRRPAAGADPGRRIPGRRAPAARARPGA